MDILKGKKTYIVLGATILFGAIDTYNATCLADAALCKAIDVPPYIYSILAATGIYTRAVANK